MNRCTDSLIIDRRMTVKTENPHVGSSLDDFLRSEGLLEEARSIAIQEALAFQARKAIAAGTVNEPD
jgi:hypothetical protein